MTRAALRGDSLQAAVAQMQREGLMRSTSATTPTQPTLRSSGGHTPPWRHPAEDPHWRQHRPLPAPGHQRLVHARPRQGRPNLPANTRETLDSGYMLGELLEDGSLSDVLDGPATACIPSRSPGPSTVYLHPVPAHPRPGPRNTTQDQRQADQRPRNSHQRHPRRAGGSPSGRAAAHPPPCRRRPAQRANRSPPDRRISRDADPQAARAHTSRHRVGTHRADRPPTDAMVEPARPGQHHDLVEAVLAHAFAETSNLNEDSGVTEGSAFGQPLAISDRFSSHRSSENAWSRPADVSPTWDCAHQVTWHGYLPVILGIGQYRVRRRR